MISSNSTVLGLLFAKFLSSAAFVQQLGSSVHHADGTRFPFTSTTSVAMSEGSRSTKNSNAKRREFLSSLVTASIGVAVGATSVPPADAQNNAGMLPDLKGGYVKPKGLGGLPRKIRSVGDLMVSSKFLRYWIRIDLQVERTDLTKYFCTPAVFLPSTLILRRMNYKEI